MRPPRASGRWAGSLEALERELLSAAFEERLSGAEVLRCDGEGLMVTVAIVLPWHG
jgi:hypothetical protein